LQNILSRLQKATSTGPLEIQAQIEQVVSLCQARQYEQVFRKLDEIFALEPSIAGLKVARSTAFICWRLCLFHAQKLGQWPDISNPTTYNEHVLQRVIFDRDPRLRTLCDKVAVRGYIQEKVGDFNVPTYGVWDNVDDIDWAALPDRFVLKPSHASGAYRIVQSKAALDRDSLIAEARGWLSRDFSAHSLEWGYSRLPRRVIAEPLLQPLEGESLVEVQVYVVAGRAAFLRPWTGAKSSPERRGSFCLPNLQELAIATGHIVPVSLPIGPSLRDAMVDAAEKAAAGFSFLRVDFYLTNEGLRIGELTPYPGAGRTEFRPPERDAQLGQVWAGDYDLLDIPRTAHQADRGL